MGLSIGPLTLWASNWFHALLNTCYCLMLVYSNEMLTYKIEMCVDFANKYLFILSPNSYNNYQPSRSETLLNLVKQYSIIQNSIKSCRLGRLLPGRPCVPGEKPTALLNYYSCNTLFDWVIQKIHLNENDLQHWICKLANKNERDQSTCILVFILPCLLINLQLTYIVYVFEAHSPTTRNFIYKLTILYLHAYIVGTDVFDIVVWSLLVL